MADIVYHVTSYGIRDEPEPTLETNQVSRLGAAQASTTSSDVQPTHDGSGARVAGLKRHHSETHSPNQ